MKAGNRKRSLSPILKFTMVIVLLFLAGFFIFYSIDNPGFLENRIPSIFGGNGEEDTEIAAQDTGNGETDNTSDTNNTGADASDGEGDIAVSETEQDNDMESSAPDEGSESPANSLSLWQRITSFITGLTHGEDNEEDDRIYPASMEINIYFGGTGEEKKLVTEKRTISSGSPDVAVKNAMQELLKGPAKSYHFPVIPAGTELIDADTKDNIAKIDLSQEFLDESLDTRILDEYIIYSIVNTLTELPEIEGVIFYIEGIRIKVYGNIDLSVPAIRDKELIAED